MSIVAKAEATFERFVAPAGNHPARCIRVLDLGTHTQTFQNETKDRRLVRITWEIPSVMAPGKDDTEHPAQISQKYTLSLHERAKLRKDLESWRGQVFTPDELAGFDLSKLASKTCLVNVTHGEDGGRTYAYAAGVSSLPAGLSVPETDTPTEVWSVDDGQDATFEAFPDWLKDMITPCKEWSGSGAPATVNPASKRVEDDDVPF